MTALAFVLLAALASTSAPESSHLEPPFTADQIRDNFPVGTVLVWRTVTPEATSGMRWTVLRADDEAVTFEFQPLADDGHTPAGEATQQTTTWAELRTHALYPREGTQVQETKLERGAGAVAVRRYVRSIEENGVQRTETFDFDLNEPGPPLRVEMRLRDGTLGFVMTLVSRTKPPLK